LSVQLHSDSESGLMVQESQSNPAKRNRCYERDKRGVALEVHEGEIL
jgi:hypothetical protein